VIYCNGMNLNKAVLDQGYGKIDTFFCTKSEFEYDGWAQQHGCAAKKTQEIHHLKQKQNHQNQSNQNQKQSQLNQSQLNQIHQAATLHILIFAFLLLHQTWIAVIFHRKNLQFCSLTHIGLMAIKMG